MNHLRLENDFGSVELSTELREAHRLISEAAWTLQMTTAEFVSVLDDAPDSCPCCDAQRYVSDVEHELAIGYDKEVN